MRRAEAGPVVAVEVLVEHELAVPGRVALEAVDPPEAGPSPVRPDEEQADEPLAQIGGDLVEVSRGPPVGYSTVSSSPKNLW